MAGPALSPLEQQILTARTKVQAEMPDVANVPIEPMGWLDRLIASAKEKIVGGGGSVAAMAHPSKGVLGSGTGSVAYSPEILAQMSPGSQEDTVAHELKHVQQNHEDYEGKGLVGRLMQKYQDFGESRLPYGQQPHELEAFQFEGDRAVKQGRVPDATPNFSSVGMREKGSYNLPEPKLGLIPGNDPGTVAENVKLLVGQGYAEADAIKRAQTEARRSGPRLKKMS